MADNVLDMDGGARRLTALEELELELAEQAENRTGLGPRIWQSWWDMRGATRKLIEENPSEQRLLFFVLLSDIVFFLASALQTVVAPPDSLQQEIPLAIGLVLVGALLLRTTCMYLFSFVLAIVCKSFGGQGTWRDTRVGVFWGAIAAAPIGLLMALLTIVMEWLEPTLPFLGNFWVAMVPYWIGVIPFMWIVSQGLAEAQRFKSNFISFIVLTVLGIVGMTAAFLFT
ncbi:MAG: YIP1 family protein [Pseudomonadota bacterium]